MKLAAYQYTTRIFHVEPADKKINLVFTPMITAPPMLYVEVFITSLVEPDYKDYGVLRRQFSPKHPVILYELDIDIPKPSSICVEYRAWKDETKTEILSEYGRCIDTFIQEKHT